MALQSNAQVRGGRDAGVRVEGHKVAGQPVVVVLPPGDGPWPVVYALSGLGEMVRGRRAAAWGWVEKYGLVAAMEAAHRQRLSIQDFQGLVDGQQLAEYNRRARSYRGVVVVCPAVPRKLTDRFVRHLMGEVIPWAERKLPIMKGARHRGVDGISLGGRHALKIGFDYASDFRTLGTEQAAARRLRGRLAKALSRWKGGAKSGPFVNLLTSHQDPYRSVVEALAGWMRREGVRVRFQKTAGRHDKRFVKGPGAIDMLLFHDRLLW